MSSKNVRKSLGKGFDILVPLGVDVNNVAAGKQEKVHKLALDIVVPKSDQPRRYFDEVAMQELADSIVQHGILQPLIVSQLEQNLYSIIAGERRWRAAKMAGLTEVPAIIRSATEHEQLEMALLENIQRADLSPLELAVTIQKLHIQFGQDYDQIAKRLGKAHSTLVNTVRLLNLPLKMQTALRDGLISEGHARSLLSLKNDPKLQQALFNKIIEQKWSVRQAEQFVVNAKKDASATVNTSKKDPKVEKTAGQIKHYLGVKKVSVQKSLKGSGKVVINFASEAEFKKIVELILRR